MSFRLIRTRERQHVDHGAHRSVIKVRCSSVEANLTGCGSRPGWMSEWVSWPEVASSSAHATAGRKAGRVYTRFCSLYANVISTCVATSDYRRGSSNAPGSWDLLNLQPTSHALLHLASIPSHRLFVSTRSAPTVFVYTRIKLLMFGPSLVFYFMILYIVIALLYVILYQRMYSLHCSPIYPLYYRKFCSLSSIDFFLFHSRLDCSVSIFLLL